jgi:enoyl-CoA hydratase/carnithine racemase
VHGHENGALWLRFNRPDQLNSFSLELYRDIKQAVLRARYDDSIDTVVFTGTGRAFGTGGDLKQSLEIIADPIRFHEAKDALPFEAIRNSRKMTIAAVNGICMAGGLVATVLSDVSIAAESATFAVPETRVGLAESFTADLLFGRVSLAKTKYLIFTGRPISAAEAERIGLITEVVPDEQLYDRVREVAAQMRETSLAARQLYKEYINRRVPQLDWEDYLRCWRDPETAGHLEAFTNRSARRQDATTAS